MSRSGAARLAFAFRVEGWRGVARRISARARELNRRSRYATRSLEQIARELGAAPLLNLLPFPPEPDRGGVAIALSDRLEEEARYRPVALLYRDGRRWRLEARRGERRLGWASEAQPPLSAADDGDGGLPSLIERIATKLAVGAAHLENLSGLPIGALDRIGGIVPAILSAHDFGLFCARPNLLEEPAGEFCSYSTDDVRCARCLRETFAVSDDFQRRRREAAARLAGAANTIVYASEFVRRETLRLFPHLDPERQIVISPAVRRRSPRERRVHWPPRRVAFVGQAFRHKGIVEFESLVAARRARRDPMAFAVAGSGDLDALARLRRLGVQLLGAYPPGRLPDLLADASVDLAILASRFPETHGLALDECLNAGVPVLAAPVGALAARVPETGAGWLAEPGSLATALDVALERLCADPAARSRLRPATPPTPARAARAHLELYSRLRIL